MSDYFRGYKIHRKAGEWFFDDTNQPTVTTWMERPCGYCGKYNTTDGHDGCLGTLPKVINACCGHGQIEEAYVQFSDGFVVEREDGKPMGFFSTDTETMLENIRKGQTEWSYPIPIIRHTSAADKEAFDKLYEAKLEIEIIIKRAIRDGQKGYKPALMKIRGILEGIK